MDEPKPDESQPEPRVMPEVREDLIAPQTDFLEDVPLRDNIMASVGGILVLVASPDIADGMSDKEWERLKAIGPEAFSIYEKLDRVGLPENFQLPKGFSDHFTNEVLKDLEIIRNDPEKRKEFRDEIKAILMDRGRVAQLYRSGGQTYSDIATRIAGTARTGKFYKEAAVPPITNPRSGRGDQPHSGGDRRLAVRSGSRIVKIRAARNR